MIKTDERFESIELDNAVTDIVTRDDLVNRLNAYLSKPPLNIGRNEYCYVKIVGNHLEIGRAKIVIEE